MTIQNSAVCLENSERGPAARATRQAFDSNELDDNEHTPRQAHGTYRYGSLVLDRHRSQVAQHFSFERNSAGDSPPRIRHDLHRARHLLLRLDFGAAFELIACIELALDILPARRARRVRDETRGLRALGAALQDDSVGALHVALMVLQSKEIGQQTKRAMLAVCRFAHWRLGEMDGFYALPRLQPHGKPRRRAALAAVFDLCVEAAIELQQLRPVAGKRLALDALEMAEGLRRDDCTIAGLPASIAAHVLYEQGLLEEAEALIRWRLPNIRDAGVLECAWRAYLVLARIAMHRGREAAAFGLLEEAQQLGQRRGWPRLVAMALSERVEFMLKHGCIPEARLCAAELDSFSERYPTRTWAPDCEIAFHRRQAHARLAFASGATAEAVASLRQLHKEAVGRKDPHTELRIALQLSAALSLVGEEAKANATFESALRVACYAGLYQIFIDGGGDMDDLLLKAYVRAQQPGDSSRDLVPYIGSLVAQRARKKAENQASRVSLRAGEALSGRECDILRLVGNGLSNKRIAHALKIAPETVKSHIKRIFAKLEVASRAEAVSRAFAFGLIRGARGHGAT
jgi:ATP/maltotriose-dependent transcriptional regulator MalT